MQCFPHLSPTGKVKWPLAESSLLSYPLYTHKQLWVPAVHASVCMHIMSFWERALSVLLVKPLVQLIKMQGDLWKPLSKFKRRFFLLPLVLTILVITVTVILIITLTVPPSLLSSSPLWMLLLSPSSFSSSSTSSPSAPPQPPLAFRVLEIPSLKSQQGWYCYYHLKDEITKLMQKQVH